MTMTPDAQLQAVAACASFTGYGIGYLLHRPTFLMLFMTSTTAALTVRIISINGISQ
jgi:hypothetical protein